ncbi:MAG TPA: type II toxin-antitoxin system mRNA interferase toxin, RelE/StbE family [Bacteroidetes bacterium]|nr:type II toxin-antitoxin system mRNA interferase toxin, RelE/StbE family [Bacteroidota bacterium]
MPVYKIFITSTAQHQLDKLPENVSMILIETISKLSNNPRPFGCKKLKGRNGYRIRKGDFRIIYEITDRILLVEIIAVGHRKNIYE